MSSSQLSTADNLVEVENLTKVYPNGTRALDAVSFGVTRGEFAMVVGKSGAGKSTLLRCINRLAEPTSGRVWLEDRDVTALAKKELRVTRKKIGFVFQQFNLVRRISALENVLCGRLVGMPVVRSSFRRFKKQDQEAALGALERVGLGDQASQRADTLSGGQQQRVAIARALAQQPALILADEPVGSLDPESARVVMATLRSLADEDGIAVICNLHQVNLVGSYADRILGVREGELVLDGYAGEISDAEIGDVYKTPAKEAVG